MMIGIDSVREALIDYLKSKATITTALGGSTEIREREWQGTEFTYPNVRVAIVRMVPQLAGECNIFDCPFVISVRSELAQSSQADNIAGIINTALHRRSFEQNGVRFMVWTTLVEAIREDTRTWRAQVIGQATVNG